MKILLLSHGEMAEGMWNSVNMVCGGAPRIYYEYLREEEGILDFRQRLSKQLDELADSFLCILTDIKGGSPYTTCLELLGEKELLDNAMVIPGMNLPLVIGLAFAKEELERAEIEAILADAKKQMEPFQICGEDEEEL